MHLDSLIATNAFTEKDLQIFTGIAAQAAVAIQNARLAKQIENEAKTRAQFQRLLSPNLVEQVRQGQADDREGRRADRGDDAVLGHPRLHVDVGGAAAAGDRPHAERVLRGDGRHPVQVRRARSTSSSATRSSALFGAPVAIDDAPFKAVRVRARHAAGAARSSTARARPRTRRRSGSASASTPAT